MTAEEVKEALRRHYPATVSQGSVTWPGPWTCIEEWEGIDLLALCAWSGYSCEAATTTVKSPVVAHEVKVSRSDMRSELLKPHKRAHAIDLSSQFYFVVPEDLLKNKELEYKEPDWDPTDFHRTACPDQCVKRPRGFMRKMKVKGRIFNHDTKEWDKCPTCDGKSYVEKSTVEQEAPTLWIPRDCGLIEISPKGCHVIKKAPTTEPTFGNMDRKQINNLVRWVSLRPDPRHIGLKADMAQMRKEGKLI